MTDTKADTKDAKAADEPEPTTLEDSPTYRFATEAMPPLSDPLHPDHQQWQHDEAGAPAPDEIEGVRAALAEAAEAPAEDEPKAAKKAPSR